MQKKINSQKEWKIMQSINRIKLRNRAVMVFALLLVLGAVYSVNVAAAQKKSGVTYHLESGVLTIRGKGTIRQEQVQKYRRKVEEVVICPGIRKIEKEAFRDCIRLRKIEIPKTVRKIGVESFRNTALTQIYIPKSVNEIGEGCLKDCNQLSEVTLPGTFELEEVHTSKVGIINKVVDTVRFNSKLDLESLNYIRTKNFEVLTTDLKYCAKDGMVYTKNKMELVKVPSDCRSIIVADGCQVINTEALSYEKDLEDHNTLINSYITKKGRIRKPKKLVIPESVKKIQGKRDIILNTSATKLKIEATQLDGKSVSELIMLANNFMDERQSWLAKISQNLPGRITEENNMYLYDKTAVVYYDREAEDIVIPEGVESLEMGMFLGNRESRKVKAVSITLPGTLKRIGRKALANRRFQSITLPEGLTDIEKQAFYGVTVDNGIISIPDSVTSMGQAVFGMSDIENIRLPQNMEEIPEKFMEDALVKMVIMPKNVKKIRQDAFLGCTVLDVTNVLKAKTLRRIYDNAFYDCKWKTITLGENIKRVDTEAFYYTVRGKRTIKILNKNSFRYYDEELSNVNKEYCLSFGENIRNAWTWFDFDRDRTKKKGVWILYFAWKQVKDVTGYEIQISNTSKFKKIIETYHSGKNDTWKQVKMKSKNKKLYARIRPYKTVQGKNMCGHWTTCWTELGR